MSMFQVAKFKGYRDIYVNKHKGANPTLTKAHLKIKFSVTRCAAPITDQTEYNSHCKHLHGTTVKSLEKEQVVSVNSKSTFKLCHAMDIEKFGVSDHDAI